MTSSRPFVRAVTVTALALGVGGFTAAPAQATWGTLATQERASLQACKVATADGSGWRVKLRLRNTGPSGEWAKSRVVAKRNGSATDQVWSSGRVYGGQSVSGAVRSGRGAAWSVSFSLSGAQSGGGGVAPISDIRAC